MARTESDKEDLIAEATALVERAEFQRTETVGEASGAASRCETLTVGYRNNGSLTVYFDQDPFYQFDADGLLRRAFEGGFLYRSEANTLAKLHRERTETQTTLQRTDLTETQLTEFRQRMDARLSELRQMLKSGAFVSPRQVSQRGDIVPRTIAAIEDIQQHSDRFLAGRIAKRKR